MSVTPRRLSLRRDLVPLEVLAQGLLAAVIADIAPDAIAITSGRCRALRWFGSWHPHIPKYERRTMVVDTRNIGCVN